MKEELVSTFLQFSWPHSFLFLLPTFDSIQIPFGLEMVPKWVNDMLFKACFEFMEMDSDKGWLFGKRIY
jgi:hypothetical protein